ncbi:MAG: hypothetical protein HY303_19550 [Candidatus Wallbacteria bacterium]|nr:hypothetical protein [Candidatus Wallbacteria bacterium]
MSLFDQLKKLLGIADPCPKCGETLSRHLLFTAPAGEDLFAIDRLMKLGRAREDAARAEAEAIVATRLRLPKDTRTGVRAALAHCRACKFGSLDFTLLQDGQSVEQRRQSAAGAGYGILDGLLGGR